MKIESDQITIGKLAEKLDINIETIRYYQRSGLIKEPQKRSSGFRYYGQEHINRITFIKKAKELGFSLKEIKDILQINVTKKSSCADVAPKVDEKIDEIEQKINDLNAIKDSLLKLRESCNISETEMKKFSMMDCFMDKCNC